MDQLDKYSSSLHPKEPPGVEGRTAETVRWSLGASD